MGNNRLKVGIFSYKNIYFSEKYFCNSGMQIKILEIIPPIMLLVFKIGY